jgi:hypothetical protein
MKPQSSTVFDVELRRNEGFSVFSKRISINGNNRGIVSCFIAYQGIGTEVFEERDEAGES